MIKKVAVAVLLSLVLPSVAATKDNPREDKDPVELSDDEKKDIDLPCAATMYSMGKCVTTEVMSGLRYRYKTVVRDRPRKLPFGASYTYEERKTWYTEIEVKGTVSPGVDIAALKANIGLEIGYTSGTEITIARAVTVDGAICPNWNIVVIEKWAYGNVQETTYTWGVGKTYARKRLVPYEALIDAQLNATDLC